MSTKNTLSITPKQWFCWTIGGLLLLVLLYLIPHWRCSVGRSATKLTVNDMTTLSALLYEQSDTARSAPAKPASSTVTPKPQSTTLNQADSQRLLTHQQQSRVYGYIVNTYPMYTTDADTLRNWIGLFRQAGSLMNALKEHVFPVRSYFWLMGGWLYLEVIFWTWFGLLASLLFNVSESLRTNSKSFHQAEVWSHIAKFFYAPLCSIAVFLGLSLAITDQKVLDLVNFSPNQILVAFILGFFSGRVVDLLQRIKNVILPDGAATPPVPLPGVGVLQGATSPTLSLADAEAAIRQHGSLWLQAYPNVTGLAAQLKTTAGQPTGQASVLFEVSRKITSLAVGAIPAAFSITLPDGRQVVMPTDVQEVGITRFSYREGQPQLHRGIPTAIGSSVSGLTSQSLPTDPENWGTLGLRVHDSTHEYIVTCCHVLCGDLIDHDNWFYDAQQHGPIQVVIPKNTDTAAQQIGTLTMATFNAREDFAVVRLDKPAEVLGVPLGTNVRLTRSLASSQLDIMGRSVNMVGATSNIQTATVIAPYQKGAYEDIPNLPRPAQMQGLIKTEPLSKKGDSGAAVFILDTATTGQVVGLLIANNEVASYVLPIHDYLVNNGLNLSV